MSHLSQSIFLRASILSETHRHLSQSISRKKRTRRYNGIFSHSIKNTDSHACLQVCIIFRPSTWIHTLVDTSSHTYATEGKGGNTIHQYIGTWRGERVKIIYSYMSAIYNLCRLSADSYVHADLYSQIQTYKPKCTRIHTSRYLQIVYIYMYMYIYLYIYIYRYVYGYDCAYAYVQVDVHVGPAWEILGQVRPSWGLSGPP